MYCALEACDDRYTCRVEAELCGCNRKFFIYWGSDIYAKDMSFRHHPCTLCSDGLKGVVIVSVANKVLAESVIDTTAGFFRRFSGVIA